MKQSRVFGASRRVSILACAMLGITGACSDSMALAPESENPSVDAPAPSVNALAGSRLFVSGESPAANQAAQWRTSRAGDAALMDRISSQPVAKWLGAWSGDVRATVRAHSIAAKNAGTTAVFVAYNITNRDCGSYSAGGAGSVSAYKSWIRALADGLTPGAVVVLEPDAVAQFDCLNAPMQEERAEMLRDAVTVLRDAGALVYLDAGNARWHSASAIAARLKRAGIDNAHGFALNVSNFLPTDENVRYGEAVSALTSGKHFIIDTSRNGLGATPDSQWCNPRGRALGALPTTNTGHRLIDALLWIKQPGESDGTCNGGPSAGTWWAEYALELARNQPHVYVAGGGSVLGPVG